ncbi:inner membrane protein YiaA [Chishuiella sp.]|uniref:inner membrane protein YiaA n=1 Tax=Chishuiella sp. TaxID=1969467 RepID=UPI0028A9212E|nr:inner membrane protein YiaA [Chishuiella sp.]
MKQQKVSNAFIIASWVALGAGFVGYIVGLTRAEMELNEKGYFFTILLYGIFSVVSLQKTVRDKIEKIPTTNIYYGICWFGAVSSITLLVIGLWNATILPSEKGFYAFAFLLTTFGAITVQKNTRDNLSID